MQMSGYTKLFGSIVASTIWREPHTVRIVWITMLAVKNKDGVVEASLPGLADLSRVTIDECKSALECLMSPDEYSRTRDFDGRRIEPCNGGWFVLNHEKYRNLMSADERKEYMRIKQQESRARRQTSSTNVNECQTESTLSTHTDADADAEEKAEAEERKKSATPPATRKPAMLPDADWIAGLQRMDAYRGINIPAELQKAQVWCEAKRRKCSRPFFVNWINRACADRSVTTNFQLQKPPKSRGQCIGEAGQRYALLENYNDWPKRADGSNQTPDEVGDADWKKQLPAL